MDRSTAAELLELIVERASALREAGILSVQLDGAGFTLAPAALPAEHGVAEEEEVEGPADVLRDPWTHGRPAKGAPASMKVQRRPI
jgi:hypothetical protein